MFLIRNFSSSSGSLSILQCILWQTSKLGRDKSLAHHDKRELKMPWNAKSKQTRDTTLILYIPTSVCIYSELANMSAIDVARWYM